MKIGFNATRLFGNSGIETYSRELVSSLLKSNSDLRINLYTAYSRKAKVESYFDFANNVNVDNCFPNELMLGEGLKPLVQKYIHYIWKKKSKDVDLIHYSHSFGFPVVKNFVTTVHDIIPLYYSQFDDKNFVKEFKDGLESFLPSARKIIVPTNHVKEELTKFYPEFENKIVQIYEAANPLFKEQEVGKDFFTKYGLDQQKKYFLYIGRLEERKNLDRIIQAYSALDSDIREDYKFIMIANAKREIMSEFLEKIKTYGASESVLHFSGLPFEDLSKFYSLAHAFVFPTLFEGFGLPIVEAMQCGAPVITSNTSCMPEIADDAALLIDPYSVDEIRDAMLSLCENEDLRTEYKNKSLKRAKFFSWDKAAEETFKIYKEVL